MLGLGDFKRAVSSLSFSKTDGGTYLVSVDDSPDNLLSVWDWQREAKQVSMMTMCSSEKVVCVEWHPVEDGAIVTCGRSVNTLIIHVIDDHHCQGPCQLLADRSVLHHHVTKDWSLGSQRQAKIFHKLGIFEHW